MLAVVILMFGVLFHATPNVKLPGFKCVTPGAIVAIVVWIIASALFAFYVTNFGSYDKTYGTLGGMVGLLVWMWITNCVLLGVELNSERERRRELEAGLTRADREIQREPRADPNPNAPPDAARPGPERPGLVPKGGHCQPPSRTCAYGRNGTDLRLRRPIHGAPVTGY